MKAIMISDKAKWCALMMNGVKKIEVRKNKGLYNAIKKLIDKYGYADIYVYCSKENNKAHHLAKTTINGKIQYAFSHKSNLENERYTILNSKVGYTILNGKVVFKFRCYKVEEIKPLKHKPSLSCPYDWLYYIVNNSPDNLKENSCLGFNELHTYLQGKNGYAIHISDLEIFDRPKELSEFKRKVLFTNCVKCQFRISDYLCESHPNCTGIFELTKAPQNFCYVEVK